MWHFFATTYTDNQHFVTFSIIYSYKQFNNILTNHIMLAWAKSKHTGKNYLGTLYTNFDGKQWFAELGAGEQRGCKKKVFCLWSDVHFTVTKVRKPKK